HVQHREVVTRARLSSTLGLTHPPLATRGLKNFASDLDLVLPGHGSEVAHVTRKAHIDLTTGWLSIFRIEQNLPLPKHVGALDMVELIRCLEGRRQALPDDAEHKQQQTGHP